MVSWKFVIVIWNDQFIPITFLFKKSSKIQDVDFTINSNVKYNFITYNITRSKEDITFNVLINQTLDSLLRARVKYSQHLSAVKLFC